MLHLCAFQVWKFITKLKQRYIYEIYENESVFFFSFLSFSSFFFLFLQALVVKCYKLVPRLTEVIIGTTTGTILAGLSNYQEKPLARYVVKSRWKLQGNYVPGILFWANRRTRTCGERRNEGKGQRWKRVARLSHLFVLRYVKADAFIIRPLTSRGLFFIREHARDTVHTRVNVRETHGSSAPPWGRPRCQTTRWRDLQDDVNATVFLDHAFRNIPRNISLCSATRRGNFILVID